MQKPTIAIIGPGRAGSALGRALAAAGYAIVAVGGRNPENVAALATELEARASTTPAAAIDQAELTIFAVPDDVIGPLAHDLVASLCSAAGRAVVHLSGAQARAPLSPLKDAGMRTGVFHPLQTFRRGAAASASVAGTSVGVDADPPLRSWLWAMAEDVGGHPFDLSGIDRVRYHAAAVLVANYSVTLVAAARDLMTQAGMAPEVAQAGLVALLQGTVNNLRAADPREALTGPAARGDDQTIQRHLEALAGDPELQEIYRLLADRSRRLKQDPEEAA
jgi:predicted short-subunit dehydrogenase-like oxidoreductase (DUF2520 family)